MSKRVATFLFFFAALAAGQALYWFIGGASEAHSDTRNLLVGVQLLIGVVAMLWLAKTVRRMASSAQPDQ